jgi:hypothetical protein
MTTVAIHQPNYLPYLGYFAKIDRCDKFVFLDNVQYTKNEWANRNKIKGHNGWQWLTVPVHYKYPMKYCDVKINNERNWRRKHLEALKTCYSKTPHYEWVMHQLEPIYKREWKYISKLNMYMIQKICTVLGIDKRKIVACASNHDKIGDVFNPDWRLIHIVRVFGDKYLSGPDGRNYMRLSVWNQERIEVLYNDYDHPGYHQLYSGFIPYLSIIDCLMNHGPNTLEIIRRGYK